MLPEQMKLLTTLSEAVQTLSAVVKDQQRQLQSIKEMLDVTAVPTAIHGFVLSALIAETANGDRDKLDSLVARALGAVEGLTVENDETNRVLETIDALMKGAEAFFEDRPTA